MTKKTAQEVFEAALANGRAHSDAFRQGAMDFLHAWVDGFPSKACPFEDGTVQADAWDAGQAKGRALALANAPVDAKDAKDRPAGPAPLMTPADITPAGMAPAGMAPAGMAPAGMAPADMTPADALRLAINVLRDTAESARMPSGLPIDPPAADLHAQAADVLNLSLQDLRDHE